MGMTGSLYEKVDKNDMRAQCFLENRRFLTKYGHESRFFYLNWHFLTIYGHQSRDFFMKNGEKGYPIDQRKINGLTEWIIEFNKN